MILNPKRKIKSAYLIHLYEIISYIRGRFRHYFFASRLRKDKLNLLNIFKYKYPVLVDVEGKGEHRCISCKVCEEICPSNAIKIKSDESINFPSSLKFGKVPSEFLLDINLCHQCAICLKACPVSALTSKDYQGDGVIDLTQQNFDEKAPL